ncbi:uncharacterized protein LOC135397069 [Ornithodoros turicata]|uniref:uncharacterized protein LOC135397069 n=1 Tax=Ornithodoros turicata TaxID=34597 RepID=UPI00313985ED
METKARIENGIVYSPYPNISIPETSLAAFLKSYIQKHGDKVAMVDGTQQWTFSDVERSIERYAAGFQSIGLQKGDKVCVHFGNTSDNLLAMHGIIAAGGTVVCCKPTLTPRELSYQLSDSECTYILTDRQNADKVAQVKDKHQLKALLSMEALPGFFSVQQFTDTPGPGFKPVDVEKPMEDVAALLYTSGTTGLPKGAQLTHYGLVACIAQSLHSYHINEGDVILNRAPITHTSGFTLCMSYFAYGATIVMGQPAMSVPEFVETVNKYKVSSAVLFPTQLKVFVDSMETQGHRTPSIQNIIIGGSCISPSLAEKTLKLCNLTTLKNVYALTEACGITCATPSSAIAYDTIGVPGVMVQAKILDIGTGRILGPGESGELVVKLPNVMKGYYKRPEATAEVLTADGWLRTGDCAYYDENGWFYFVERLKDMIKCMDNQLAPAEIEEVLLSHEAVAEATVVGIPDSRYGEAPTAFVVLKAAFQGDPETVKAQLHELVQLACAKYKHLYGGIHFVDRLPKTETGKVQRAALRQARMATNENNQ